MGQGPTREGRVAPRGFYVAENFFRRNAGAAFGRRLALGGRPRGCRKRREAEVVAHHRGRRRRTITAGLAIRGS